MVAVPNRLSNEEKRRLVLLALANDDNAFNRKAGKLAMHGGSCGLVGSGLVTATAQAGGSDG